MNFPAPLKRVQLIKRYKRFLADVRGEDGREFTIHTPNTGSMMGCAEPGMFIWIRKVDNPRRKYAYTWELSETADGVLIGVNTSMANHLVREAIEQGVVETLQGYEEIRAEMPYGIERSRIDLLLSDPVRGRCYVEVKNVTARHGTHAIFPDAVSARGTKHLRELRAMVADGHRGVIFFCVQRGDVERFRPADEIDPLYAQTLREVVGQGVEALAWGGEITTRAITLTRPLPVDL